MKYLEDYTQDVIKVFDNPLRYREFSEWYNFLLPQERTQIENDILDVIQVVFNSGYDNGKEDAIIDCEYDIEEVEESKERTIRSVLNMLRDTRSGNCTIDDVIKSVKQM